MFFDTPKRRKRSLFLGGGEDFILKNVKTKSEKMLQINHRPTRGNRILVQNTTFCATFSTNGGGGRKDMTFCSQKRGGLKGGYALGFHGFWTSTNVEHPF